MTCSGVYQNAIKVQNGNFSSLEFFYFWINNIPLIFQEPVFPDYFQTTFTYGANFLYFINHKFNYCYWEWRGYPAGCLRMFPWVARLTVITQCLHSLQDFCVFSFSKMGYSVFKKKFLDSATFLPQIQAS